VEGSDEQRKQPSSKRRGSRAGAERHQHVSGCGAAGEEAARRDGGRRGERQMRAGRKGAARGSGEQEAVGRGRLGEGFCFAGQHDGLRVLPHR